MTKTTRDVQDDHADRLPILSTAYALSMADVALLLDLPLSTLDMMRAKGIAPPFFKVGRRLYTLQTHYRGWLDEMAKTVA